MVHIWFGNNMVGKKILKYNQFTIDKILKMRQAAPLLKPESPLNDLNA